MLVKRINQDQLYSVIQFALDRTERHNFLIADKSPPQASTWPLVQPQLSLIHSNMVWQVPALRHLKR